MVENYTLPRDDDETARLLDQHHHLVEILGCLVHPAIPITTPDFCIADMATGSAIWLLDLAKGLSINCQLHGFDISSKQYPPAQERPINVFLHQQDILQQFPKRFHGFFDVIAVRLVTLGLRDKDWDTAVENFSTLLKPGGYIQWLDADHTKMRIFNNRLGAPNSATREIANMIVAFFQRNMYPGPLRLPELYEKNGLRNVAFETVASDKIVEWRRVHTNMFIATVGPMVMSIMVKDLTSGMTAKRAEELLTQSLDEVKNGDIYSHSELHLAIGQKPKNNTDY